MSTFLHLSASCRTNFIDVHLGTCVCANKVVAEDEEWAKRWGFKGKPPVNADVGFDFTMTAQMKLFDLDGSAGTFMSEYSCIP